MHPRSQGGVEKLSPFVPHVKHKRFTEEEMLEPKTGCHSSKVEQISANACGREECQA